jgi:hypothetical protein
MDIIVDIFDFIFEELPRRVAVSICAVIGGLLALAGFGVRGHYHDTYALCHSAPGQMAQAFSTAASSNCTTANLMTKGGLIVGVVGLMFAATMVIWLFKLMLDPPAQAAE